MRVLSYKIRYIYGFIGQSGGNRADVIFQRGCDVHGVKRGASSVDSERIDYLYQGPHEADVRFHLHYGDMTESTNLIRGETFVTRKIARAAAAISLGFQKGLYLGNPYARRGWGHACDRVEGMWRMLQHDTLDDSVFATGETRSLRSCVERAFAAVDRSITLAGSGGDEVGRCMRTGETLVEVDLRYFRPIEVDLLIGGAAKAHEALGWRPRANLDDLGAEMVARDLELVQREHDRRDRHG